MMRKRNTRFVWTGLGMVVLAILFFFGMASIAPKSHDPATMMTAVGQVSGVVGALGLALAGLGVIGKKA